MWASIWRFRGFILANVWREFQARYRHSILGALWNILNPLAMIVIYTVVFSQVMKARLPGVESATAYGIFLCAGSLSWGLFSEVVSRCQTMFIDHGHLLKKIQFPKSVLPIITVLSALMNFAIPFGLFLLYLLCFETWPGWPVLALLPVLVILLMFASGLGLCLGVLNVFYRDVGAFFAIALQFWFWLTPIVYPAAILPEWAHFWMDINPMAPIIEAFQQVVVAQRLPDPARLVLPAISGAVLCLLGLVLMRRHAAELVDEL